LPRHRVNLESDRGCAHPLGVLGGRRTRGCISLENADVAELVTLVPIGTLVLIEDWQGAGSGGYSETRYERRVYPAALSLPAP